MNQQNLPTITYDQDRIYQEEDFCIIFDPPISAQLLLEELQKNE